MGFESLCLGLVTFVSLAGTSHAVIVRAYCLPSNSFDFVGHIRLNTEGDTSITGITAVDASVDPTLVAPTATTCTTSVTESTNIYHLEFSQNTNSPSCGTTLLSGTTYKMMVRADGSNDYHSFTCDTSSLLPSSVAVNNFATTGVTSNLKHRENPYDVMFQAVEADGNKVPATSVELGQDIKLRLIYNTGTLENSGRDNWGKVFHTGFIQHPGAELVLLIVTPGLGTKVHITGKLSGKEVDSWVSVKRDKAIEVSIPVEYQATTATKTSWTRENRGLKIEALHDRIGVKVLSADKKGGDFIVLPDDILGKVYRPFSAKISLSTFAANMEVVVVGVNDQTAVQITYNGYTRTGSFQVAGVNSLTGPSSDNIALQEHEVLHILCDAQCSELVISADQNIALVTGFPDQQAEQLVPLIYYGKRYVYQSNNAGAAYLYQNADPTDTNVDLSDFVNTATAKSSPDVYSDNSNLPSEVTFGEPTTVFLQTPGVVSTEYTGTVSKTKTGLACQRWDQQSPHAHLMKAENFPEKSLTAALNYCRDPDSSGFIWCYTLSAVRWEKCDGGADPALSWLPAVSQWSLYNFFYAQEGVQYSIYIVTTKGDAAKISVSKSGITTVFTASTLGAQAGFASRLKDVKRLKADSDAGQQPTYEEYFTNEFDIIDKDPARIESGLIEFRASSTWKPFMMLIFEDKDGYRTLHLPFGVRYPMLNPCTASIPRPGDLLDNDCDGSVDEEILNGRDDDNDNKIDEDVALNSVTQYRGIYVKELLIDDNAAFSSPTQVHQAGCNTISSTSPTAIMKSITPFTHNTALAQQFNHYWVLDTGVFKAFKYITSNTLYFRVVFGFCYGNLDLCQNSCSSSTRRKRSSAEDDTTVDLKLAVRGNNTGAHFVEAGLVLNKNDDQGRHPCSDNMIFWIPVTLLLAIILVEIVMLVYLFYKRSHLLKKLQ